ncbi:MAG: hypothetical protein Q9219_002698 [cf. Caloplaca sp. 3 TL-2023]
MSQNQSSTYSSPSDVEHRNELDCFIEDKTFTQIMDEFLIEHPAERLQVREEQPAATGTEPSCTQVIDEALAHRYTTWAPALNEQPADMRIGPSSTRRRDQLPAERPPEIIQAQDEQSANVTKVPVALPCQDSDPEQYNQTSKRAQKRAALLAQGIPFGTDFRKIDEVSTINGALHTRYRGQWVPAVYHYDLRAEMVARAPPSLYEHQPAHGRDELDVTSYWEAHHTWGFKNREERPDILFNWLEPEQKRTRPGIMEHQGRIVIDTENHPVKDWPIPFCLSSAVEPGRLEAMSRENGNQISKRDFRARMPATVLKRDGRNEAPITENAIGMRRFRFRDETGSLAWEKRDGTNGRKKALVQCIPVDKMAEILVTNSTKCFRDLTKEEIMYINTVNHGQNLEKAGSNRIRDDERQRRKAIKDAKLADFDLVNEDAWPYLDDLHDDTQAIARAQAFLGLASVEPCSPSSENTNERTDTGGPAKEKNKKRTRSEDTEPHESRQDRPSIKRQRHTVELPRKDFGTPPKIGYSSYEWNGQGQSYLPRPTSQPVWQDGYVIEGSGADLYSPYEEHGTTGNFRATDVDSSWYEDPSGGVHGARAGYNGIYQRPFESNFSYPTLSSDHWLPSSEGGNVPSPFNTSGFQPVVSMGRTGGPPPAFGYGFDVPAERMEEPSSSYAYQSQASTVPVDDYRFEAPVTWTEIEAIRDIMGSARYDFEAHLGFPPPEMGNEQSSYMVQWLELQAVFESEWQELWTAFGKEWQLPEKAPQLQHCKEPWRTRPERGTSGGGWRISK